MSLQLKQLGKDYGGFKAVDGIDLCLEKGEILGLLGPNGSGKTTTVRMIGGLLKPSSGDVIIDGFSIASQRHLAKGRLGILPDNDSLFPHVTLEEHLLMEARVWGVEGAETRCRDLLAYCDLWERRDVFAGRASVGMRKKLGISLALIHLPPVVVLDEPFEGLDPISARQIRKLLLEVAAIRKTTVLITSHILSLMEGLVDRAVMIHKGKLIRNVAMADLRRDGIQLEDAYLEAFDGPEHGRGSFSWLH